MAITGYTVHTKLGGEAALARLPSSGLVKDAGVKQLVLELAAPQAACG